MHTSLLAFDVHSWLHPISTPGSSHSWPPCVKREVGEGAALLLSQMQIPQLKWKIHLLSVMGALPASILAASQITPTPDPGEIRISESGIRVLGISPTDCRS